MKKIENIKTNKGGIYFIYDQNKELMYIGKSKNIRKRLYQHINPKNLHNRGYKHNYYYCYYIIIQSQNKRDKKEIELIKHFQPPLNHKHNNREINYNKYYKKPKIKLKYNKLVAFDIDKKIWNKFKERCEKDGFKHTSIMRVFMESFFENKLSIIDLFKITNKKRNEEKITRYKKKIIYKKIDKKENKEVIEKENKPKFNKRKAINQVVNSIMK